MTLHMPQSLRATALAALQISEPQAKCAAVLALPCQLADVDPNANFAEPLKLPCRPERPELVASLKTPQISVHTAKGRASLLHALAHIELNAIDLALDIIWRFPLQPAQFYLDWAIVAQEEAKHFGMLADYLRALGYAYGDFPAHTGLWDMAEKTKTDLLGRLAIVPRTLEARGLDASPAVRKKFAAAGDQQATAILDTILQDEIGHVRIGNHWYLWLCEQRQCNPQSTYAQMLEHYALTPPRGPFNLEARRAAGFGEADLQALENHPRTQPSAALAP